MRASYYTVLQPLVAPDYGLIASEKNALGDRRAKEKQAESKTLQLSKVSFDSEFFLFNFASP